MPRLDLAALEPTNATGYPRPHDAAVSGRWYRRLAPTAGFKHLRASQVRLEPGAWSSQRHWHREEDELVVILEGEAVLVEDGGETMLGLGDVAVFPAGIANGHHLQNRSKADCVFLAVSAGDEASDSGIYSDINMVFDAHGYARKDGSRYDAQRTP
jgi:uncharacterized cupin superfamily protein